MIELTCSLCGAKLLARQLGEAMAMWLIHMADTHRELIERILATTQDPAARVTLIDELRSRSWAI